jgi:Peptidase family S41
LIQHPKPNRFTGKVYFLMNGGSGSTTAEFLAVAHSNKLGVFVGEECAGNYTGGNGGEFISVSLPNSKIQVGVPLLYYHNAVTKPIIEGRGTLPDYFVPNNIKDILTKTDTQLNFTFDLIKKGGK